MLRRRTTASLKTRTTMPMTMTMTTKTRSEVRPCAVRGDHRVLERRHSKERGGLECAGRVVAWVSRIRPGSVSQAPWPPSECSLHPAPADQRVTVAMESGEEESGEEKESKEEEESEEEEDEGAGNR